MPIYTLEDLREKAPRELRSLSDEELVREYSRRKKRPFEEVADNLGLKPSGFLSEMGRQFMGGLSVDVPRLVGQGQQFLARELPGLTEALETGAQAQAAAQPAAITAPTSLRPVPSGAVTDIGGMLREEAARAEPRYVPDMRGRGLGQEILLSGMRAVGPVASTVPFSVVPGGMPLAVAGLFGLSQAQDTYEKLIAQGVPEDEARQASYRTGAIQGVGEGFATYVGGKLFKPLLGRVGGATTGEIAAGMTDTGILKPFAKGMATNLLVQPTTEIAQDVGTSMVEQAYGAKPEDLMDIAKQSAMGATGLTLLLGPLAFGAHVSRSNNAAALKAALSDDPTVPREIRAQAIAAVNVEAQRQGIAPRDIASWTQEQIELEDRRTDALRRMAESAQALEVGAGIEQRLGIGAPRLDEASYIQQFEEAFNEPSGQFTYETLPDGSQAPRELTMGEVINRQANTDPNAAKDLLTSNKPKTAREVLAEIRQAANDPLSPSVWRFPVSTGLVGSQRDLFAAGPEAFTQRPVRGELTSAQQAALGGTPPMGAGQIAALRGPIDQTAPRPAMGLGAAQQFAAAGPQAQTSATIPSALVAPSGGTPATVSPSAPVAPGAFSTAPAAPKAAAPKKTTKPKAAVTPKKPTAPSAIEQALEEELDLADTASDAARVNSILNEVNKEKLEAEVQGAKQIKAPGRVSLSQRSLLGIRDAIFRKSGKVAKAFGRNEQKIVDAVRRFTNAYDAYLNFSTNLSREVKKGIAAKADERMAKMDDLAKEVQNALFALGQSMDNNAKNVEAVVRVVKDAAQRKLAKPGKTKKETLDAIESLDSVFSSGWAAAKRESFMKELPDLADVSGQQIRPSTEKQEKGETISAVEDAAKNGYSNPKYDYGKRYTGLAGILQYLRFNTTPMGRVLSKALRDALVESENPAKVVFTDKGGSRYDPKTNTVYINRGEQSAEVVLHETFHAALQWFVYQNPDLPAVKQLQLSLERALAAKGLEGKALEVQVILQELVNKKRGLDAVLELVSYTATLNDFRRAMQEIKTGDAPKSFLESVRSVWAMYKAIVRRMLGVNDTVASDVLSASMDLLEESRSSKYTIPEKLTGKVLDIATTAFKRWFGDSKVVDENGQPLVVYHGTNRSFTAFAKEVLGKATGAPSAKLGFFFAGDPSTSAKYAKNAVRSSRLDSTVIDTYKDMLEKKKAELSEAGFQKAVKSQLRVLNNLYEEEKAQASDAGYNRYLKSRGESILEPVPKDAYIKERERSAKYYEGRITELENNPESYREEHNKVVNSEISALQNILDKEIEAQGEEQKFGEPAGPNIVPVYLSIKNPMIIDQKGEQYRIMSYYDTVKKAQSLGHDGVIIKNTYDGKLPPGWVTRLVSKWRNEPVPSDTIYIAFEPNQIKSVFNQAPTEAPGILEAKVQSGKQKVTPGTSIPSSPEAAASGQNIMMSKTQLSNYTKTLLPRFTLTETLFNQLGWQDWIKYADRKWITPFNKFIQKETPNLSQAVSWFNSHYGLESNIVEMLVGMKDARRGGTAVSEKVAKYIADMPVSKSKELLSYMNDRLDYLRGIRKEPKFSGDDTYMKRLADQAIDNWWKYATEGAMSSKDRTIFAGTKVGNRWVGGLKFTEGFVFPESVSQVASASFGSRNMRELKSRRTKDEVGTDNIRFRVTVDGDPILTDKFVGIYNDTPQLRARLQAGESLSNIMPDEFISAELFTQSTPLDDKGQAMLHDPAFTWDLQKKGKTGFRFSAHYDAREAYSAKKAIDVANAFQNTMTLLANSYASNTFAKSLYDFGTTKVGSDVIRDGSAVVFDDIDQLNEAINGEGEGANFKPQKDRKKWSYEIKPDKIIRISSDEARSERTKGMFRNRNQWVMVPKGKDGEVYGALSGKIVSGSVWAAIQDASDRRPVVSIPYAADIMRFFKSVKTKYLPATWATNVATNVVFSIADDIPLSTIPHAARLYLAASMNKEMRQKLRIDLSPAEEELMVKILNSNALLGTFASDEIKKGIYEALSANLNGPERNIASRIMQMAGVDKARIETIEKLASTAKDKAVAFDNYATEWYAAQDNIFRVASVLNYLGKAADAGMEINESVVYRAGKHARQAFLDYDIDAKAIRIMRQTAFPFISFPYAATKLLGRLVVNSPWKLVNIYAAAMIMDMMLASMADDDDDETRRTGPEKYRERLLGGFGPHAYFRIPFMGDSDNPVYYHVGKYLFPSSLMDTSPNGFMGISWFPSAISPGGPYVNTILATVAGVDAFNGKPLSDSVATDYEKVIDRLTYLQSMMTPNLPLINIKETQKFADIASGRTDLPKGSTSLALARYMGLRIYNYNVDAELEKQDQAVKGIEADYKKAISKLRKKTERMEEPDWDAFYEKEDELLERMEKRIAELRGEEE